jgi:PAS domain S-box-containing protein
MKKIVFIILLLSILPPYLLAAEINIKVGVYQNEPLVFIDEQGKARGLYIDIIEAIASKEGWEIEYVECLWPECLKMLQSSKIDLMTDIAYSEERSRRYAFTDETIFSNWGRIYVRIGNDISSFLNLHNKRVVGVRGDIYYEGIRKLARKFNIEPLFMEVSGYDEVLELLSNGEADAGITSRLYGIMHERNYTHIKRSPIVCCPVELRFALPKNARHTPYLIKTIDKYLREFKGNRNSIYYKSLDHWIGGASISIPPSWVKWVIAGGGVIILVLVGVAVLLNTMIELRTRALKKEIERREEVERSLRESEAKFRILVTKSIMGVYLIQDGVFKYCNPKLAEIFGYSVEELIDKKGPKDLTLPDDWPIVERNLRKRLSGEVDSVNYTFRGLTKDRRVIHVEAYGSRTEYRGRPAIIGTLIDITDRVRAEKEIRERMEELERFYKMAVDRELRMKELKEEIEQLREELSRYKDKDTLHF